MVSRDPGPRSGVAWGWFVPWLAFVAYAVFVAPPDDPTLLPALLRADLGRGDPSVVAVFNLLGVVPVLASRFVLDDGASRKLPAWPFAAGMFALGAFALLPWFALRSAFGPRSVPRAPGRVRRLLASPRMAWGLVVVAVGLTTWGAIAGHGAAYAAAFRTTKLVHVMTIDLVVCSALLVVLAREAHGGGDALARLRWIPLFGVALENALRHGSQISRRTSS
ncbi:MAG: hypothetical protein U0169_10770 [Polyangiaceae bacterium]